MFVCASCTERGTSETIVVRDERVCVFFLHRERIVSERQMGDVKRFMTVKCKKKKNARSYLTRRGGLEQHWRVVGEGHAQTHMFFYWRFPCTLLNNPAGSLEA